MDDFLHWVIMETRSAREFYKRKIAFNFFANYTSVKLLFDKTPGK